MTRHDEDDTAPGALLRSGDLYFDIRIETEAISEQLWDGDLPAFRDSHDPLQLRRQNAHDERRCVLRETDSSSWAAPHWSGRHRHRDRPGDGHRLR